MVNIRKLESELWEAADLLRADSKVTSQEYCMPVLGLIFLRYAYSRFKFVEADILKDRPVRNGRVLPVEADDFKTKSAIYLPEEARYEYLLNLPDNAQVGEAINHAMELIEEQSAQLKGILPKSYTSLKDDLLRELLRIFNNSAFNEIKDDIIGRIYEYFLNKFAPVVASDDGVFFTPKSLVRMIVNIIEPNHGTVLDPACGSGGMFVSSADFIESFGANANTAMTFYGQEKLEYNAKLCIMNMAVHGLNAKIVSGDEANSFYKDAHNLAGCCDFVMANPPFNVDKVKSETTQNAGRLPFGLPSVNKNKEISNANYLWISYFYAYLNETGRAGFVMAASATDSQGKDKDIRQALIETGDVDVMISVGTNFFYTKSLPCSLWFFDKAKKEENRGKVLFIDARNYYILLEYDKLIKVNNKQIKLLEEAAQRIYKDWFIDCSCPRYRGSIEEHALRNTWQRKKAEDFFDITIGKTPPRAEKQWFAKSGEGIPWASISDMGNSGTYIFKSSEDITREAAKQFNMKIIPAGSILVSFKLTVGRVSIVTKEMCTNEAIAHFRVTDSQRAYAYLYLKAFEYDTLGNTSAISKAVNSKIIKAMPFVMPDDETLNEFSSIVSPILDAIYCKQAMNRELLEARDRLLPKLMNGEIEI